MNKINNSKPLSKAEKLWIYRKREGRNQTFLAKRYKVSYDIYSEWERGIRVHDIPNVQQPYLTDVEVARILRRREGMLRTTLAKNLGVSLNWLRMMENGTGNPKRLVNYWKYQYEVEKDKQNNEFTSTR